MPWKIYKEKNRFCVHKVNPDGSQGEQVGCHPTEDEARAQQKALYVNAEKAKNSKKPVVTYASRNSDLQNLINRIIGTGKKPPPPQTQIPGKPNPVDIPGKKNPVDEKKPMPGKPPKPAEAQKPGKNNPIAKKPMPGNPKILARGKKNPFAKELNGKSILFTKEGEQMRWLTDFSNNFRDRDNPPEILASIAHEQFVKEIDEGLWPMPELWWWHIPGTRLGQADWVGYDKENGIALASGYIDKGMEPIAEAIDHYPEKIGTSHGMIVPLLERDSNDPSTIVGYVSREISALPARAAANTLTEIHIGKEMNMALTQEKRTSLELLGYSPEQIEDNERRNQAKAEEAKAAGIESKEAEGETTNEEVVEASVEASEEKPPDEPTEEAEEVIEGEKPVTHAELEETIKALVKAVTDIVTPIRAEQNKQATVLAQIETKAKESAMKELSGTPTASMGAIVAREMRAAGNPANLVDGRSSLVKSGPPEAPANTGLPTFLQKIIQ
jgi:hypothetical protein